MVAMKICDKASLTPIDECSSSEWFIGVLWVVFDS